MINWDDPDYVAAGHFYSMIQSVSINCSDPAGSVPSGAQSYVYGANATTDGLQIPSVLVTNQTTVMNGAVLGVAVTNVWKLFASLALGLGGSVLLSWA